MNEWIVQIGAVVVLCPFIWTFFLYGISRTIHPLKKAKEIAKQATVPLLFVSIYTVLRTYCPSYALMIIVIMTAVYGSVLTIYIRIIHRDFHWIEIVISFFKYGFVVYTVGYVIAIFTGLGVVGSMYMRS